MRYLFVHNNFPAQFIHTAPALAADPENEVVALTLRDLGPAWEGVRIEQYAIGRGNTPGIQPWVSDWETKVIRGEAAFRKAMAMKAAGFTPDVIIAHPGWGESLFLKDVWPDARLAIYCEFFYRVEGQDVGFDPEFLNTDPADACRLRLKNLSNFTHFEFAEAGLSPTHWQASTFPEPFRSKITVAHDGIDTDLVAPDPDVSIEFASGIKLTRDTEIITFVNRNLEPYRGYHTFMRALPEVLKRRPDARVLIVGGDQVSYGAKPQGAEGWKNIFIREIEPLMPEGAWERVHFLGRIGYSNFVKLLQLSTVHVYLTYPFVLSWSLLESMSAGCAIIGSDTKPLHEAIHHGETGRLVDFFDPKGFAEEICALLDDRKERERLGQNARAFAKANYDLRTICLPAQMSWIRGLS